MATIEKKILPEYFDAVASGKKKFELRMNEFEAKEGDTFLMREWDPVKKEYTGRQLEKKITYARVFKIDELYWPVEEIMQKGLLILSLE
ncbi:DUF3850 domain-containing protein [Candidatus Kaiserbacteria bacterium]|nr:DUF3850 domain-containing protein [Candidatus Kaiserbacteria bacterium]